MGKLHGTDGARGIAVDRFDPVLAGNIGRTAAAVLPKKKNRKPLLLVGWDSEEASAVTAEAAADGICSAGSDAELLGCVTATAMAALVKKRQAAGGIMVTEAAGNKCGIRIYDSGGYKLSDDILEEIERLVFEAQDEVEEKLRPRTGELIQCEDAVSEYLDIIRKAAAPDLTGMRIAYFCSSPDFTYMYVRFFSELGAEMIPLPDIPEDAQPETPVTDTERLMEFTAASGCCCGLAFRGGGEKCLVVDENGKIVDADKLAAIFARSYKEKGLLDKDTVVITASANLGLHRFAEENGIKLVTAGVGERSVIGRMREGGYKLGGDKGGRIFFMDDLPSGDGLLTGARLMDILRESGGTMSSLAGIMHRLPQVVISVRIAPGFKEMWKNDSAITCLIDDINTALGRDGRVIVRENPGEAAVSVLVEGEDFTEINDIAMKIAEIIKYRCSG